MNSRRIGFFAPITSQLESIWGIEHYPENSWHGLQVFAVDGALFSYPYIAAQLIAMAGAISMGDPPGRLTELR